LICEICPKLLPIYKLAEGDNLIVSELSRLDRSMLECMELLVLATEKSFISMLSRAIAAREPLQSKIVAMVFSMAAEIERSPESRTKAAD
jgi:DNA invertase Pin-like site-specific DNA recombinase